MNWYHALCISMVIMAVTLCSADGECDEIQNESITLSQQQMEEDLLQLSRVVQSAWSYMEDKGKNFHVDPEMIRKDLVARLNGSMNRETFFRILKEFIARLKDGHARVYIPGIEKDWAKKRLWPLEVVDTMEGIIVSGVHPSVNTIGVGDRLLSANGQSMEEIIGEIAHIVPASTDGGRRYLAMKSMLWTDRDSICFTASNLDDQVAEVSCATIDAGTGWVVDRLGNDNFDWRFLSPQIGYMRIPTFQPIPAAWKKNRGPEKRRDLLKPTLEEIDRAFSDLRDAEALIIDVRDNQGGTDLMGRHVARHLLEAPFVYFQLKTHISNELLSVPGFEYLSAMSPQDRKRFAESKSCHQVPVEAGISPFRGKIFILINEGCFSVTDNFAACMADLHPNALFLGSGTHGGTGAPRNIATLVHSRAEIHVCVMHVWSPNGRLIEGRGTKPDIDVRRSRIDVIQGRDPVLGEAIEIAKKSISVNECRAPDGMMIEFLQGPAVIGITDSTPEFGWIVNSTHENDFQIAYRILLSGDQRMLARNEADVWDSKRTDSDRSQNVSYNGKPLQSKQTYYWKVKTWCKLGGESNWSEPMRFTTGDLKNESITTRYPLRQTPVSPVSLEKKTDGHYLVDFGKVAFGYLQIELDSPENDHPMEIHFGERGDANGVNRQPGGTVRYYKTVQHLKSGSRKIDIHPPKDRRNTSGKAITIPPEIGVIAPFRYVELVNCPAELETSMIRQVAVHYPFVETNSSFESCDPVLDRIWDLCKYSMKATSFCGVYVDGDRERIPYEADAYINQLSHYAVDREYTLARYSHEYLLAHPTWPTEWKQHSVLIAWADWMYTGNSESLAQHYDLLKAEKTLEHRARPDGLLDTEGLRDIVDWPKEERDGYEFKEVNTVVNAFYYKTLLQMADIAAALGKQSDANEYLAKAGNVKSVFNEVLFDTGRGIYLDGEGAEHASLHANMLPLAFGLVPKDRKKSVVDYVVSRGMACSVYGAQYLLEALYESGRPDVALERMTSKDIRSWYNMLRVGSTITLEAWDDRFKDNQDWNHAWGAAPGNIIPRYLLGVRPLEPGFRKVLIQPQPASLKTASGTIPTVRGPVKVSFRNEPTRLFELRTEIPVNMTATVGLPRIDERSTALLVDGKKVTGELRDGYLFVDGIGSGAHVLISR